MVDYGIVTPGLIEKMTKTRQRPFYIKKNNNMLSDGCCCRHLELALHQLIIRPAAGQQLFVATHFPDHPFVEHDDLVGLADGT